MPDSLPDVPGLSEMDGSFLRAFVDTARSVGVDADRLAALVSHESRFEPWAQNEIGATGLIQFLPSTAAALGTSPQALKQMSATEQLPFVAKFFARFGHLAPRDVILAAFGQGIGRPDDEPAKWKGQDAVPGTALYDQNPGLDTNHDGVITFGDVRAQSDNMLAAAARRPRIPVPALQSASSGTQEASGGVVVGFFAVLGAGLLALARRKVAR